MNRQQVKELLPIIQAFAEGKTIQTKNGAGWIDINDKDDLNIESIATFPDCFRIKPEPKYRPFKDAGECWQEMQKHQPIGWTKLKGEIEYSLITDIDNNINYSDAIKEYTFADGTPFGIKD